MSVLCAVTDSIGVLSNGLTFVTASTLSWFICAWTAALSRISVPLRLVCKLKRGRMREGDIGARVAGQRKGRLGAQLQLGAET